MPIRDYTRGDSVAIAASGTVLAGTGYTAFQLVEKGKLVYAHFNVNHSTLMPRVYIDENEYTLGSSVATMKTGGYDVPNQIFWIVRFDDVTPEYIIIVSPSYPLPYEKLKIGVDNTDAVNPHDCTNITMKCLVP